MGRDYRRPCTGQCRECYAGGGMRFLKKKWGDSELTSQKPLGSEGLSVSPSTCTLEELTN